MRKEYSFEIQKQWENGNHTSCRSSFDTKAMRIQITLQDKEKFHHTIICNIQGNDFYTLGERARAVIYMYNSLVLRLKKKWILANWFWHETLQYYCCLSFHFFSVSLLFSHSFSLNWFFAFLLFLGKTFIYWIHGLPTLVRFDAGNDYWNVRYMFLSST